MGDIKLLQQPHGAIRIRAMLHVVYRSSVGIMDDIAKKVVEMAELKIVLFCVTLIGIPAYIYAWFLDIRTDYDLWKSVILGSIGAFTGLVIGLRYLVKLLTEWKEFLGKYYPGKKKKS